MPHEWELMLHFKLIFLDRCIIFSVTFFFKDYKCYDVCVYCLYIMIFNVTFVILVFKYL